MIRLQPYVLEGLAAPTSKEDVWKSLQQAIELEHATIPVYLYALYSLDAAKNGEIVDIIQSVVIEEMLHMTLVANVLNALGGSPQIDKPEFIPKYPGPLPGGVESDLIVNLAPFSMNQLQAFLTIEEPEDPLNYRLIPLGTEEAVAAPITIGQFYTAISDAIAKLGDGAFVKPPRNQVGPDLMRESVVVTDVASAQRAIQIIIEQGEGTADSPQEVTGGNFAHYYRYMQIAKGRELIKLPGKLPPAEQYVYGGSPIPFNATGVYNVPTNPTSAGYPAGSIQRFACDNFNYTYTNLLTSLHALFNGDASQAQFNTAIGVMMSLKGQAKAMMSGIPNPAVLTGPSFEYQPVNP